METIKYLETQRNRMSADQLKFLDRVVASRCPSKIEEERLVQLYMWLHMEPGSIAHRRFTSDLGIKGRRRRP